MNRLEGHDYVELSGREHYGCPFIAVAKANFRSSAYLAALKEESRNRQSPRQESPAPWKLPLPSRDIHSCKHPPAWRATTHRDLDEIVKAATGSDRYLLRCVTLPPNGARALLGDGQKSATYGKKRHISWRNHCQTPQGRWF